MSEQCVERVHKKGSGSGFGHYERCTRIGIAKHDGCWYCGIHNPERVKARQDKRAAERERESKMRLLQGEIDNALRNIGELFCIHPPEVCGQDERYLIGRVATLRERLAKLEGANQCKAN